jgi:NDP-sugar pyrophosphorylase family protein
MKVYSASGFNDFVICLGYKGYLIKEFFANYFLHTSDCSPSAPMAQIWGCDLRRIWVSS